MSRIPWISIFLMTLAALLPPGRDFVDGAFLSNEALTRNIARPIVVIGFGIFGILAVLEWYVRNLFYRRRSTAAPAGEPTE